MADLVLKNVDQAVIRTLEQRAKQLGITLEAAAIRALSVLRGNVDTAPDGAEREMSRAFLRGAEKKLADLDGLDPHTGSSLGSSSEQAQTPGVEGTDARSLQERQATLARRYPDEYVVLLEERVVAHTADKDEAYAHYDAAFEEACGIEPIVVAPGSLRRLGPPILRGRALSGTGKVKR